MKYGLVILSILAAVTAGAADEHPDLQPYQYLNGTTSKLIDRMITGMGGPSAMQGIESVHSISVIEVRNRTDEDPLRIEIISSFPDKHLARVLTPQGTLSITINDDLAYILPAKGAFGGAAIKMTADERNDLVRYFNTDPLFVVRSLRKPEYRFAAAETSVIAGVECQALRVSEGGSETKWWIDLQTGRVVRSEFRGRQSDFSDWKQFGKLTLPQVVTTQADGKVVSRARFDAYEINPELDLATIFRRPELWLARWNIPQKPTSYGYSSSYSSYSSSSWNGSSGSYSGYSYRPPTVRASSSSIVIWDTRTIPH